MAYQKNAKQSAARHPLAKQRTLTVRGRILSDEQLVPVCEIFWDGLPKLARMSMKREKFQTLYRAQREKVGRRDVAVVGERMIVAFTFTLAAKPLVIASDMRAHAEAELAELP